MALAALGVLTACGQKGDLYLPTAAEATGRASLPQTLLPGSAGETAATSASPAASPAATPGPAR